MSNAQTIADLRATADLIERNGLTKHALYDRVAGKEPPECPVCSVGGVNVTVWGHPRGPQNEAYVLPDEAYMALSNREDVAQSALLAFLGEDSIPAWNDAVDRTQEEVVSAFRDAADALEKEGGE